MEEKELMSRKETEVAHPQTEEPKTEEVAQPQDGDVQTPESISSMTSEEFEEYLMALDERYPDDEEEQEAEQRSDTASIALKGGGPSETVEGFDAPQSDEPEDNRGLYPSVRTPEDSAGLSPSVRTSTTDVPQTDNPTPTPKPFRTFATEEEYTRELDSAVSKAFDKRFKEKENEKNARILHAAKSYYGAETDDPLTALAEDLEQRAADTAKIPVEDFRKNRQLEEDAKAYREQQKKEREQAQRNTDIISQWERDATQLKFIEPEFDFRTELQSNPQFRQLISQGMGVIEAYASSRPQPQKQEPPKQAERKPIKQNAQSPDGGTGTNTRNPANMSSAEFKQYIDNIRNS